MYIRIFLRQLITNNEHILFALICTYIRLEAAKDRFLYIFENELLNYQVDLLICYEFYYLSYAEYETILLNKQTQFFLQKELNL